MFGARGPGHRDGAALVRRRDRLVLDRVARAAGPGAGRVAALDDERRAVLEGRRPVEDRAVVEAARGERDEVAGRDRRQVGLDLDGDRALRRVQRHGPGLAGGERRRLARRAGAGGRQRRPRRPGWPRPPRRAVPVPAEDDEDGDQGDHGDRPGDQPRHDRQAARDPAARTGSVALAGVGAGRAAFCCAPRRRLPAIR